MMRTRSLALCMLLAACGGETGEGTLPEPEPGCWWGWVDADGDGHGDPDQAVELCEGDSNAADYAGIAGDCDDTEASVHPLAAELCDGLDNDCDGEVDGETAVDQRAWYSDEDGDGYGDPLSAVVGCEPEGDTIEAAGDCDDGDGLVSPDADELCDNHIDDNCDGRADEGFGAALWGDPAVDTIAQGVVASWTVTDCADEGCPTITYAYSGGASAAAVLADSDGVALAGARPADVSWEAALTALEVDAVDGAELSWTFTPAEAYDLDGLVTVLVIGATGGPGEGPVVLTADQDLEVLGVYDHDGGGAPVFLPPDTLLGTSDSEFEDGLMFFALPPDAAGVTLGLTLEDGATDGFVTAVGYLFTEPCGVGGTES